MECGDTFLMPAPGGPATPHLWIVITQPDATGWLCVIVSVTTLRYGKDQTVVLRPGDHPFIRHDSTVFFGDSRIVDARKLDALIEAGAAMKQEACPARTLKLVQDGLLASPFTPLKVARFCRERWAR